MNRFSFIPERLSDIATILTSFPRTQTIRNEVFNLEGIHDPERHHAPIEIQVTVDSSTLVPDATHKELLGTHVGPRVLFDAERYRPSLTAPVTEV